MTNPEPLATQTEVAAYLRISVRTLRRWEAEGDGPPRAAERAAGARRGGWSVRYEWDAVKAWAAGPAGQARRVQTANGPGR